MELRLQNGCFHNPSIAKTYIIIFVASLIWADALQSVTIRHVIFNVILNVILNVFFDIITIFVTAAFHNLIFTFDYVVTDQQECFLPTYWHSGKLL